MEYQYFEKFEYKIVRMSPYDRDLERKLNELGKNGWELISFNKDEDGLNKQLILKRKLICYNTDLINE
jgi:hypothetical protein